MAERYSIDGQILTDMADAIRTGKSQQVVVTNNQFLGNNTVEYTINIKPTMPANRRYKMTLSCSSASGGAVRYITLNVYLNTKDGTQIFNSNTQIYANRTYEAIFTTNEEVTALYIYKGTGETGQVTFTFEPCDEDGNVICYYTPQQMVEAVNGLLPPESAFNITGDAVYRFTGSGWNWFLEKYGKQLNVTVEGARYMFSTNSAITEIPFEIKFDYSYYALAGNMFEWCTNIRTLPKLRCLNGTQINDISYMFQGCSNLREVPIDYFKDCNFYIESYRQWNYIYNYCYSLRSCSLEFFELDHQNNGYSSVYASTFNNCASLDRIVGLPATFETRSQSSNNFISTFNCCSRLDRLTFKTKDIVYPWSNQTINLSDYIGYAGSNSNIIGYNSGIGSDKEVKDMETYEALKNDPDWYTCDIRFSRYNHDSAVETINSLPKTSGSNTIMFKGEAGSLTDGGAINTLTDAEIAVAAAKGWTVALS